jgi:hypothetical protein
MVRLVILLLLLFFIHLANAQNESIETIIAKHLNNTTYNVAWEDLVSFGEKGTNLHFNGRVSSYYLLKKWPDKLMSDYRDSSRHTITYINGYDIVFIENGFERKTNFGIFSNNTINSQHNFSFALSKIDNLESKSYYLRDTLIQGLNYHLIKLKEKHRPNPLLILIDSKNYRISYIKSMDFRYDFEIYLEDYRWVNGYLFAFKETHYKHGKLNFVKIVDHIELGEINDSKFDGH